jgi:putative transposase
MGWKIRRRGENLYHHIYAWGNDRHPVFKKARHYKKYLGLLQTHSENYDIDIIAYALLEWHVHMFLYDKLNNISDFMMKLHGDYAQYYNTDTARVGHVFGERFNNKIVSANIYGKWLSRYIHRQALEAGLVKNPTDYPWSSYRVYIGLDKNNFLKPEIILTQFGRGKNRYRNYAEFVLADKYGPVDWNKKFFKLRASSDLINFICKELKIERKVILKPHGADERRIRHRAIKLLIKEYGYKAAQIAHAFGLSRAAITKIFMI